MTSRMIENLTNAENQCPRSFREVKSHASETPAGETGETPVGQTLKHS